MTIQPLNPSVQAGARRDAPPRQFTSDNRSGICPEAWAALAEANAAPHARSYGDDDWTHRASDALRRIFETDCDVYFVFNGTAANSLALASCAQSFHSVICHETAHVETDECGAPEFFSNGTKLLLAPGEFGKLSPDAVEALVRKRADIHYPKPRVVSITNSTELGTVYTPDEVGAICRQSHGLGLNVQMDGARFGNAVASLGCAPADVTWRAGVDVLCMGGTKNGMSAGEAVIFFNRKLSEEFSYRCKQAGQLASKMRFLSSQWVGLLENGAWLRHAQHANAMATLLSNRLAELPGVRVLYPVEANGVFAALPPAYTAALRDAGWELYTFIGGGARFMCGWDTVEADIDRLIDDLRPAVRAADLSRHAVNSEVL